MTNEQSPVIEENTLSATDLEGVAGGFGILEGIAAGLVIWVFDKTVDAVYEWSTKADRPPYTNA